VQALTAESPLRQTFRSPLARTIEAQLAQRSALFNDCLLSISEVRVALGGIGYSKIQTLIKNGELPTVRIGKNGHRKVRASAVKALLAAGVQS